MDQSNTLPVILPLFRSDSQLRIIGELFTNPGLETTVGELADRVSAPRSTVSREVARLTESDLLRTRRQGNRTLVHANLDTSISSDLRSLLSKVYGPLAAIRTALERIAGIAQAFIFGSWAARWHGEPGPIPNDIDLLVIGEADPTAVWEAAAAVSNELGIAVNPVLRTQAEWADDPSGFATTVRQRPTVDVTPHRHGMAA